MAQPIGGSAYCRASELRCRLVGSNPAKHRGAPFGQLPDVRQIPALSRQPAKSGTINGIPRGYRE